MSLRIRMHVSQKENLLAVQSSRHKATLGSPRLLQLVGINWTGFENTFEKGVPPCQSMPSACASSSLVIDSDVASSPLSLRRAAQADA